MQGSRMELNMNNIYRFEKIKNTIFQICNTKNIDLNAVVHLSSVAYLSGYIAGMRNLNKEICICAGFLHDLWLFLNMSSHDIFKNYERDEQKRNPLKIKGKDRQK
jgi:HD superfamily phosphodiesterase